MICVVMEHVCWITTSSYQMNPRFTELVRPTSTVYAHCETRARIMVTSIADASVT